MDNMFEQTSRLKLRFESSKGLLSVEDLWDLPLTSPSGNRANLDSIAIALHKETREAADTVSFVSPPESSRSEADLVSLKFEIVKHVIRVRVQERDELKALSERREKKQRILELIAKKKDNALEEKSVEELESLAQSL